MTCGQSTFVLSRRTPNHRLTTWPSSTLRGRTVLAPPPVLQALIRSDELLADLNRENLSRVVEVPRTPDGVLRTTVGTARFVLPKESASPEPLTTRECRADVTRGRARSRFRRPVAKQGCGQPYCCCSHEASRSTSVERHPRGLCIPFQEARRRGHVWIPGPDVFVTTAWTPTPRPRWLAYEYASN